MDCSAAKKKKETSPAQDPLEDARTGSAIPSHHAGWWRWPLALLLCLGTLPRTQTLSLPAALHQTFGPTARLAAPPPLLFPPSPTPAASLGSRSQRSAFWTGDPGGRIKFLVRGPLGIFRVLWLVWLKLEVSHSLGRLGHTTACKGGCGSVSGRSGILLAPHQITLRRKFLPPFILHEWRPERAKISFYSR